jgi:hypothetical protein
MPIRSADDWWVQRRWLVGLHHQLFGDVVEVVDCHSSSVACSEALGRRKLLRLLEQPKVSDLKTTVSNTRPGTIRRHNGGQPPR